MLNPALIMKCRDCPHTVVGTSKGDEQMRLMGYKSCSKAKTAEEKGRFVKGDTECVYPERLKK